MISQGDGELVLTCVDWCSDDGAIFIEVRIKIETHNNIIESKLKFLQKLTYSY